jgi:hypothetical protein
MSNAATTWIVERQCRPEGDVEEAKNKHLLPPPQSEEAELNPLC